MNISTETIAEVLRGELIYRRGAPIEACHGAAQRFGWRRAWLRGDRKSPMHREDIERIPGVIVQEGMETFFVPGRRGTETLHQYQQAQDWAFYAGRNRQRLPAIRAGVRNPPGCNIDWRGVGGGGPEDGDGSIRWTEWVAAEDLKPSFWFKVEEMALDQRAAALVGAQA